MIKTFENFNKLTLIRGVGKNPTTSVDLFGRGLYLTDDIEVAKFYGDKIETHIIDGKIYDTTKDFTVSELRQFYKLLDNIFQTKIGAQLFQDMINYNEGIPKKTDIDYMQVSWALNSNSEFYEILKKRKLDTNKFNSYANDCTAMNMVLKAMGYIGLKYSTTEIEDLDAIGLGNRNAYLIFN